MNKRVICFALIALMLALALGLTFCNPDAVPTASAASASKPVWHVTVYSPKIDYAGYISYRDPKYTIDVDDLNEIFRGPYLENGFLTIHRDDGTIELVSVSLVEIKYY